MIPTDWQPHRRASDGELVGYLVGDGARVVPLTLVGHPLAGPSDPATATAVLEQEGLAALARPWWLSHPDGREFQVLIVSAYADRVEVVRADYGFVAPGSERLTLEVPEAAARLQPVPVRA